MRIHLLLVLFLMTSACGAPGTTTTDTSVPDTGSEVQTEDAVVFEDAAPDEGGQPDAAIPEDLDAPELIEDTAGPACAPGEGCFLDPCEENGDCASGWCVGHMGEDVCTLQCETECPPGWSCQQVPGTAPDVIWLCVSAHANLCLPCGDAADCKGAAGADDACLDYGDEGSFCGGICETDADCPWGFSCADATTVDGAALKQCVADAGVCPCTKKSVALGLATPCEVGNDLGICGGLRMCTEDGLTDCDAAIPVAELCNGLDDDCDGETDEPHLVDGEYVAICDDGNDCTDDLCEGDAGCSHLALDEGECVDGDVCTVGDHCAAGVCVGSPVACDDGNPCTDDVCDGLGGCDFVANLAGCDDGDPCTVADQCVDAICVGVAVSCDCQVDGDCAAREDGDLCNGTLICDVTGLPFQCAVDPLTVVTCPLPPEGPEQVCLAAACDPLSGACAVLAANDGGPCNDGDICTFDDACDDGACVGGGTLSCEDGNPCTGDWCDPATGCQYDALEIACDDGNACTTIDMCAEGQCLGSGALDCDDANACTTDACDPVQGCVHGFNDGPCDDGDLCTVGESCSAGVCAGGVAPNCNDGEPCTDDGCAPLIGCTHTPNTASCSDGDVCTTGDICLAGGCVGAGALDCADGNPCTGDWCDPTTGCQHDALDIDCDDGNACTATDTCVGGLCQGSGAPDCDDDNVCTTDACDADQGCVHVLHDGPCDDGDLCTTGDHCHLGTCIAAGALTCDDGNLCTDDACDGLAGCTFTPNVAPCSDGNACTLDDACSGGWCVAGGVLSCDDDNLCTDEACDPDLGCVTVNNAVPCDDDDPCTITDVCSGGSCVGSGALPCDDDDACTSDACVEGVGCAFTPIAPCCGNGVPEPPGEECDDGNDVDDDGCGNDCMEPSFTRTVPGFSGTLGPDLSSQGWSQCAGTGSKGVMGVQWYPLCEGYAQIRFACSTDNNESAEYLSPSFPLAGKVLLDYQCDNWNGASNSNYGSDYILSVDSSNPGCGNYNVGYQMYMHFGTQWGCAEATNTHNTGGRMFAYVSD